MFYQVNKARALKSFYCSRKCAGKAWASKRRPPRRSEVECRICLKTFMGKKCQCYCSAECRGKMYTKQHMPEEVAACEHCGKQIVVKKWGWYKKRFCSKECRIIARPFPQTRSGVRRAAMRRGMPMISCSLCGYCDHPEILTVHHKDLNPKNNKRENLIVVCPNCHSLAHQRPVFCPSIAR